MNPPKPETLGQIWLNSDTQQWMKWNGQEWLPNSSWYEPTPFKCAPVEVSSVLPQIPPWTTEKPTELGWYWIKDTRYPDHANIVKLEISKGKPMFISGNGYPMHFEYLDVKWQFSGPIPQPQ